MHAYNANNFTRLGQPRNYQRALVNALHLVPKHNLHFLNNGSNAKGVKLDNGLYLTYGRLGNPTALCAASPNARQQQMIRAARRQWDAMMTTNHTNNHVAATWQLVSDSEDFLEYVKEAAKPLSADKAKNLCAAYLKAISIVRARYGGRMRDLLGSVTAYRQVMMTPVRRQQRPQPQDATNITIDVSPTVYDFHPDQVYVCFANKRIGGGVTGAHGFVQEEVAIFQSNQFPLQMYWRDNRDSRRAHVELNKLDEFPAILRVRHLFDFKGPVKVYGRNGREEVETKAKTNRMSDIIEPRPADIYWANMAAIDLKKSNDSAQSILERMHLVAWRCFMEAAFVCRLNGQQCVINTGKWGCGDFGHDPRVSFGIQKLAAEQAAHDARVPIHLRYHAFDVATVNSVVRRPIAMSNFARATENARTRKRKRHRPAN